MRSQPGIVTDAQAAGWAKVAEAVHAEGGTVFMQLMNGGRVTHPAITGTDRIVAPSAIAIQGDTRLADGTKVAYAEPHALETSEARKAVDAGFDVHFRRRNPSYFGASREAPRHTPVGSAASRPSGSPTTRRGRA
ncbi:oxidoreductase [Microbacterium sp. CFBP 13617]|uniref:oxidoreductase n=1 Tax=Microbacterium sp. CFBP 13617 TaxID=2774035 RepID=UPI00406D2D28